MINSQHAQLRSSLDHFQCAVVVRHQGLKKAEVLSFSRLGVADHVAHENHPRAFGASSGHGPVHLVVARWLQPGQNSVVLVGLYGVFVLDGGVLWGILKGGFVVTTALRVAWVFSRNVGFITR